MMTVLRLSMFALVSCVAMVHAADDAGDPKAAPEPLDFPAAVELALRQSPLLQKGMIKLEVQRLNERDGRAGYWPSIYLRAEYLIDAPESVDEPFSIRFSTGAYNPVYAYFATGAQRYITQLTELTYLEAIGDGLHQAGELFLLLALEEQANKIHARTLELAEQRVTWWRAQKTNPDAVREIEVAEAEQRLIGYEYEKARIRKRQLQRKLAAFVGLKADDPLPTIQVDLARKQVLGDAGDFADAGRRDKAEAQALELKQLDIQIALQKLGVKGAYAEYLPRPTFTLRSTDPFNETQEQGLHFFVGASLPIWDVGRRRRNVQRQKALLQSRTLDKSLGVDVWRRKWDDAVDQRRIAELDRKSALERYQLAQSNRKRQAAAVEAGRTPWPVLLEASRQMERAHLDYVGKQLQVDRAALRLVHLSRALLNRYVKASALEKELDVWNRAVPEE